MAWVRVEMPELEENSDTFQVAKETCVALPKPYMPARTRYEDSTRLFFAVLGRRCSAVRVWQGHQLLCACQLCWAPVDQRFGRRRVQGLTDRRRDWLLTGQYFCTKANYRPLILVTLLRRSQSRISCSTRRSTATRAS